MKIVTEVYAFSSEKLDQRNTAYEIRLTGYFCSDTIFNLSKKVLLDAKNKNLEIRSGYAPVQN